MLAYVSSSQPIAAIIRKCMKGTNAAGEAHKLETDLRSQSFKSQGSKASGKRGIVEHAVIVSSITTRPVPHFYIITTIGGSDPSTFPRLLKRFLVPITTTSRDERHIRHLHITPTWRDIGKPIWVIAYLYPAEKIKLGNRWEDGHGDERTHYTLDAESLNALETMSAEEVRKFENEELLVQNDEVDEYKVRLTLLVDANKDSNSFSALGGETKDGFDKRHGWFPVVSLAARSAAETLLGAS